MKKQIIALIVFLLVLAAGTAALYLYIDQSGSDDDTLPSTSVAASCENVWLSGTECYPNGGYGCFEGQLYTCYNDGYAVGATATEDLQVCGTGWLKNYSSCSTFDDGICGVVVIDGKLYNEEDVNAKDCQLGANPVCGNGTCEVGESCGSCSSDCGSCPVTSYCGDGVCDFYGAGEWCGICGDCGVCAEGASEAPPATPPANSETVAEVVNPTPVAPEVAPINNVGNSSEQNKQWVNDFVDYYKEETKIELNEEFEEKMKVLSIGFAVTFGTAAIAGSIAPSFQSYLTNGSSSSAGTSTGSVGAGTGASSGTSKRKLWDLVD